MTYDPQAQQLLDMIGESGAAIRDAGTAEAPA
jgi:hypothetical protein